MKNKLSIALGSIVSAIGACGVAQASPCYEILDGANQVVYLAPALPESVNVIGWRNFNDQLRMRGHHLRWYESYNCPDRSAISMYGGRKTEGPGKFDTGIVLRNTPPFGVTAIGGSGR